MASEANNNVSETGQEQNSMGQIISDHQVALSLLSLSSLVLGVPLALNMMWHLRVANESR